MINQKEKPTLLQAEKTSPIDKLVSGYDTMMEKLFEWSEKTDEKAGPVLIHGMEETEQFLHDVGKWSKEEIDLLSRYVKRDLRHIAQNLEKTNSKFIDWLDVDSLQVEKSLLNMLSSMADHTRLELDNIKHLAESAEDLHTGEVTTVGSISCKSCGKEFHFHRAGRIPPCASCHKTIFIRTKNK